jgi:hypothetical protein
VLVAGGAGSGAAGGTLVDVLLANLVREQVRPAVVAPPMVEAVE